MDMATQPNEIKRIIDFVNDVTAWSPVPSGIVLRVHEYSYPAWLFEINDRNRHWMERDARSAYEVEWADTDQASNILVAEAALSAGLSDVNKVMNEKIGIYSAEQLARALDEKSHFVLFDIGAGTGATALKALEVLLEKGKRLNPDCKVILIEPSEARLRLAKAAIEELVGDYGSEMPQIILEQDLDVFALRKYPDDCADLCISNAAIHHNAGIEHLKEINRVLKPGRQFINGDWHNSMWESPARVYWLLNLLQNPKNDVVASQLLESIVCCPLVKIRSERHELKEFRKFFSLDEAALFTAFNGLEIHEKQANAGIIRFWLEVAKRFSEKKRAPIFFLEGHERVSKRIENLKKAEFVFDRECRSKYAEMLRGRRRGELSAVMVAKKRC